MELAEHSQAQRQYADQLIKSSVFTSVLQFMSSDQALEARKLSERIAKISAGNFFQSESLERLELDLDVDFSTKQPECSTIPFLRNVTSLRLKNLNGSQEKLDRFLLLANSFGKSVKSLELEFDDLEAIEQANNIDFNFCINKFNKLEKLILSTLSSNSLRTMLKQPEATSQPLLPLSIRQIEISQPQLFTDENFADLALILVSLRQKNYARFYLKYTGGINFDKLLAKLPEDSIREVHFSLDDPESNALIFAQLQRMKPDSMAIEGGSVKAEIDRDLGWPEAVRDLRLLDHSKSIKPLVENMPERLQHLSISHVSCFSFELFRDVFAQKYSGMQNSTLKSLSLVGLKFNLNSPEATKQLLQVLNTQRRTLEHLDLSCNLIENKLVKQISAQNQLQIRVLTLLNLKRAQSFSFCDCVSAAGAIAANNKSAVELRFSRYQVQSCESDNETIGGEQNLAKRLEENIEQKIFVRLI